jgi:hypothetical protein
VMPGPTAMVSSSSAVIEAPKRFVSAVVAMTGPT